MVTYTIQTSFAGLPFEAWPSPGITSSGLSDFRDIPIATRVFPTVVSRVRVHDKSALIDKTGLACCCR